MYGLIGQIQAVAGRGRDLADLLAGTGPMPGCHNYLVACDADDEDSIWVTEIWESEAAHRASLDLPAVRDAIAKGRPLIEEFKIRHELAPVGGLGLDTG